MVRSGGLRGQMQMHQFRSRPSGAGKARAFSIPAATSAAVRSLPPEVRPMRAEPAEVCRTVPPTRGGILPAMGCGEAQVAELEATIRKTL
jgi:hypothetical protein